jgi:anti-anti-sigma regulatory factor
MANEEIVVGCGESLTISEASEMREVILNAFQESADVTIECSSATEVDVTFLQLLVAGRRAAEAKNASLSVSAPLDSAVATALRRAGFVPEDLLRG